ncbi:plasmid mobilization relaxosome protein MobC [Nitratireductor indicus]|nr:plasmid mobilization relaxosome protein MobC [Nitratireductor indicus]MDS1136740.1 plasmid mobilization relaxosome protein MobC [Nitratireductor indicus]
MRATLGLVAEKRRRPVPKADPALVREIGRIGGNLNQIARWLNAATLAGHCHDIDALVVAARLVAIERAMSRAATPRAWATPERGARVDASTDTNEPPPC